MSHLGEFEHLVLLAILRLGDDAYGVPIAGELEERAGRQVSRATVHVTLQRLEEHGLVASELGPPRDDRGGRPRRYWRVLPAGTEMARQAQRTYRSMWQGVDLVEESAR